MEEFWNTLKEWGKMFVQDTGLTIVRTLAFLILGLVVIKIVQAITRRATLKSTRLDHSAATFIISIVTVVLYVALVVLLIALSAFLRQGSLLLFLQLLSLWRLH